MKPCVGCWTRRLYNANYTSDFSTGYNTFHLWPLLCCHGSSCTRNSHQLRRQDNRQKNVCITQRPAGLHLSPFSPTHHPLPGGEHALGLGATSTRPRMHFVHNYTAILNAPEPRVCASGGRCGTMVDLQMDESRH